MRKKGRLVNKVHVLRAERRWTQNDVAEKLNVSRMTISSIEAGRYSPSLVLAFEIATLFGKEIGEVFQYLTDEGEEA